MRLTNYSDFALRSLIYLAIKPNPNELANISDIAKSYNISKSHLTKIIHQLGRLGYIESVRGKNGGIRLAKKPTDINIGTLIRHTESDFALVQCFEELNENKQVDDPAIIPSLMIDEVTDQSYCVISPVCHLKTALAEATQAFIAVLDKYTLADFLRNPDELLAHLNEH